MTRIGRSASALAVLTALALSTTALPAAALPVSPTPEVQDAQLLLLLDASGSMSEPATGGQSKIDAARSALTTVIDGLDPEQQVGLRVFGGSVPLDQPTEAKCTDSDLVVPVGSGNADDLRDAVSDYAPLGETPISYALQQAADDLGTEGQRTVLLVSDGIATCEPDPCEIVGELESIGLDLVVHTVGLGVDANARSQLQCVASAGGGSYYDAEDAETLAAALERVSVRAFKPFSVEGDPVEGTRTPEGAPLLEVGQYTDVLPEDDASLHYRLQRTMVNSTLHVGVAGKPMGNQSAWVEAIIRDADNTICSRHKEHFYPTMTVPVLWLGARASGAPIGGDTVGECGTAEELYLTITPTEYFVHGMGPATGTPFEIAVTEEPGLASQNLPETTSLPEWQPMQPAAQRQTVSGGSSFNDATLVEPGSYDLDILPGEVLFFRVSADFGQAVQAQVDTEPLDPSLREWLGMRKLQGYLTIASPERGQIWGSNNRTLGGAQAGHLFTFDADETARATETSEPILYVNRFKKRGGQETLPSTAGDYFVVVQLMNHHPNAGSREIPLVLTVDAIGEPAGVPVYDDRPNNAAADTETEADTGTDSEAPAAGTDDDPGTGEPTGDEEAAETPEGSSVASQPSSDNDGGVRPLVWILGGAGVLAAAGGSLILARGR